MKHLVITVHGIRTFGDWQERLEELLKEKLTAEESSSIDVVNYKYGWFSVIAFLIPMSRWWVVRRFRKEFLERAKRKKQWGHIYTFDIQEQLKC